MEDRLSTLPLDVLRHVYQLVSTRDSLHHLDKQSRDYELKVTSDGSKETAAICSKVPTPGLCLRVCCKRLQSVSDQARTSISFPARKQDSAVLYMQKLPNLNAVTITYNRHACNISASLISLHGLFPGLTSLNLKSVTKYSGVEGAVKVEANLDVSLQQWSGTLQHLELENIKCMPSAGAGGRGLRFLSQLPALQALLLRSVLPNLQIEDIAGCTGLLMLNLKPSRLGHYISQLDLSAFPLLQEVSCQQCGITQLNTAELKHLWRLECDQNRIKVLDLSTSTCLRKLTCSHNGLTILDTAIWPKLCVLECSDNPLSQLNVLGCPRLTGLSCASRNEAFTELDLSACTSLQSLKCRIAHMETLNLQVCPKLRLLSVYSSTSLLTLDLAGLQHLRKVNVSTSSITSLDVSGCTALEAFDFKYNRDLATLSMTGCSSLQTLTVKDCPSLQGLDLAGAAQLKTLDCTESSLTVLGLSGCLSLKEVKCSGSNIRCMDVSAAAATLKTVHSDRCPQLEVVHAVGCNMLATLWCGNCPLLRELDCRGCDSLPQICCRGSGRFDGETIASLRAADWSVGEKEVGL